MRSSTPADVAEIRAMHLGADGLVDVVAAVQQLLAVLVAALSCYVLGQVLNLACNWYHKRSNMKIMARTATQLTGEEEPEEECLSLIHISEPTRPY